ncbi:hypothetical protein [Streptomyces graminilatus]|uniref:hypothetical protein n=1 Tax=Streptomyces graminilatus TaxID=1464070 RepID=UPI0006E4650F|nr:hypothetical protein [Streptomyces graminilatus]
MVKDEPEASQGPGADRWLVVLETLFVLVVVVGLALWSVAAGLVVGGVLGVLACERASADRRAAAGRHGGDTAGGERQ